MQTRSKGYLRRGKGTGSGSGIREHSQQYKLDQGSSQKNFRGRGGNPFLFCCIKEGDRKLAAGKKAGGRGGRFYESN